MTHWLAAQMVRGYVTTVETLVDPDGTVWSVGDEVLLWPGPYEDKRTVLRTRIAMIFPGNNSWDAYQPHGDVCAVWLTLENGWSARPWLCTKINGFPATLA